MPDSIHEFDLFDKTRWNAKANVNGLAVGIQAGGQIESRDIFPKQISR